MAVTVLPLMVRGMTTSFSGPLYFVMVTVPLTDSSYANKVSPMAWGCADVSGGKEAFVSLAAGAEEFDGAGVLTGLNVYV